jgi:hypothetical protein
MGWEKVGGGAGDVVRSDRLYHRVPLDRAKKCNNNPGIQCKKKDIISYPIICERNGQTTARYIRARLGVTSQFNATHASPLPTRTSRLQNDYAQGATVTGAGHAPRGPRDRCMSGFCGTEHGNCVYHRATIRGGQTGAVGKTGLDRTCKGRKYAAF